VRLLSGIWAIPSVQRIALSSEAGHIDLWILMREEVPDDEDRISQLEREFRHAFEPAAFELHVYPLSEIDPSLLPPAETILER
jgi:hypothetical protein